MNLSFKILGFEVASLTLEIGESSGPTIIPKVTVLDKGMKWMSGKWIKGMMAH